MSLMMTDRYGLFWVIIKILFTAIGYGEDQIEELFGIDYNRSETYTNFYNAIHDDKYKTFRADVISLITDFTMIDEEKKYITSEHFKDFIRVLLDLIKEDFSIDNIAAFDALLNHPFLRVPEEGQSQLQDPLPPTLQVQDKSPLQDQSPLQVQDQSLQLAVQANAGGSHKKKRRPARINQRTKKRNTRNKQNHQNRTKKGQSKRARK
jgi:hypothetical protein